MQKVTRRDFLCYSAALLCSTLPTHRFLSVAEAQGVPPGSASIRGKVFKGDAPNNLWKWAREGFLYKQMGSDKVVCGICPNRCFLAEGDRSVCRSKVNFNGKLYSLAYGNPCAVNVDPIEKKPLLHFKPRTMAFSIAAAGCNFRCLNCQNYEISQAKPQEVRIIEMFPETVVKEAQRANAAAIAYTYSEPITFFEYMYDTARLAKESGVYNLMISNGYINPKPLKALCTVIDAANINLKSFSEEIYGKLNGGRLAPVLDTLKTLHAHDVHLEITNLVVPGYVDDPEMVKRMCDWILTHVGADHPVHFLRFFPRYRLDRLPPTPVATLTHFRQLAMEAGIRYVYIGNVPAHEGVHTYCHNCKELLIRRTGYYIPDYNLAGDRCKFCNTKIPGVWHV